MRRKHYILLSILLVLSLAPVAFFARYESYSDHLEAEYGLDPYEANAAKHAYAAGQVYGILRLVLDADMAEDATLRLGVLTEYMETIVKISEPDSTREIMKDMFNNQAGIVAAEFAQGKNEPLRDVILTLAVNGGLAETGFQLPVGAPPESIEDYPQSVQRASHWFCEHQQKIKDVARDALMD